MQIVTIACAVFVLHNAGMIVYYTMCYVCAVDCGYYMLDIICVVFVLQIAGMLVYYIMCCVCAANCGYTGVAVLYHGLCLCCRLRV